MASGLIALLDDISALAKATALSLNDVPTQITKTTGKVTGIVIDDTAVTPKYVVGLDPSRELVIIYRIAIRSLINKLLILSPAALLLGYFAHWAITPILMLGGAYLCYEGYEKVHSMFSKKLHDVKAEPEQIKVITADELEKERVKGAVRTDMILSAEITAIAYYQVAEEHIINQIVVLLAVAVFITIAVYGFVGLLVKLDDIGIGMTKNKNNPTIQKLGKGIVKFMPHFLRILGYVGTAAMLWVGAEIIGHGIPFTSHLLHDIENALANMPAVAWFAQVLVCLVVGIVLGFVVEKIVTLFKKVFIRKKSAEG